MPDVDVANVPHKEAIAHFRQKLKIPSLTWDSFLKEWHAKAFTVAGASKMDLLNDLHESVADAIEHGSTITDFRRRFDDVVARHGWSYRGARGWRTRVIFDTNLRTAYAAGRWQQIQRVKKARPWMIYKTVGDARVRQQHRNWQDLALSVDDPWWDTHYPPNGWGCRCSVITASDAQLKRWGIEPGKAPSISTTPRVNTRTGLDYGDVPEGIDPGWDYNVGKAWLGSDIAFGEKLMGLPDRLRSAVLGNMDTHIDQLTLSWQGWLRRHVGQKPRDYAHTLGYLPEPLLSHLRNRGTAPTNAVIVAQDRQTNHLLGDHKDVAKRLPRHWVSQLPSLLWDYQAIVQHGDEYIFLLKHKEGKRQGRVVVKINFSRKGRQYNSVRSLGLIQPNNLKGQGYTLIDGSLD